MAEQALYRVRLRYVSMVVAVRGISIEIAEISDGEKGHGSLTRNGDWIERRENIKGRIGDGAEGVV